MILMQKHLAQPPSTVAELADRLQTALLLELSTIPPYLYAWWSLGDGSPSVAEIIREVVNEEMLHMAIVSNLLHFCKSTPHFADANLIPKYPGPLPGGIETGLQVGLAPVTADAKVVKDVFMQIEEPEDTAGLPAGTVTIGKFYHAVLDAMKQLFADKPGDFDTTGNKQLPDPFHHGELFDIKGADKPDGQGGTVKDFELAVLTIVEQGEGTSTGLDQDGDLGHYFKFAEIVHGKEILMQNKVPVPNPNWKATDPPDQKFLYDSNKPVALEAAKLLKLVANPSMAGYASSATVKAANDDFCKAYTKLLKDLENVLANGSDFGPVEGAMFTLDDLGRKVTSLDFNGQKAGPSFEWVV